MKLSLAGVLVAAIAFVAAYSPAPTRDWKLPPPEVIAVTGVTLIDGTDAAPRRSMTVLIRGGRIEAIGPTGELAVPSDSRVIDANDAFLIPGLWDMHTHGVLAEPNGHIYRRLMVAFGVTTVRVMEEQIQPYEIGRRPEPVANPGIAGPRVFRSGRVVNGPGSVSRTALIARNAGEARLALDSLAASGSDFVKVYNLLGREAYFSLMAEARRRGVSVAGHVPFAVTAAEVSEAGQASIEHLTGIVTACSTMGERLQAELDSVLAIPPSRRAPGGVARTVFDLEARASATHDGAACASLAGLLAHNRTAVTPTLVQLRTASLSNYVMDAEMDNFHLAAGDGPARARQRLDRMGEVSAEERAKRDSIYRTQTQTVTVLAEAGVALMAGTDIPSDLLVPGLALHEELELLVNAGLSPAAALRAATLVPARFMGAQDSMGTIQSGRVADLIILDADPLEDISNTRRIRGVILRGRYLDGDQLSKLRDEAARLAASPFRRWLRRTVHRLMAGW